MSHSKILKNKPKHTSNQLLKKHRLALTGGWQQLVQSPLSSLTTCLIIALSLILTTTLLVSLHAFKHITQQLQTGNQITFYLKNDQEQAARSLLAQLHQNELVKEATYVSPEEALRELSAETEFKEALVDVHDNPLPPVILLTLTSQDKEEIKQLINKISQNGAIASVHLNSQWFDRLYALIALGNRLTYVLSVLFGIGILFIISHAIAEATRKNSEEMVLAELIGATRAYLRRPFLYVGCLLGFFAGLLAVILLIVLSHSLKTPLTALLQSYSLPVPTLVSTATILQVIAFSTLLGWLGAWISFYKYAKLTHN